MSKHIINDDPSNEMILDYIFGRLNAAEEQEVEKFLDENADYADMVDGLMNLSIEQNLSRDELKNKLIASQDQFLKNVNDIIRDYEKSAAVPEAPKEKGRIITMGTANRFLKIAVILLLFAMPVASYFIFFNSGSADELVLSYLEQPYEAPTLERNSGVVEEDWQEAVTHYRTGNFEEAATGFEKIIASGEADSEVLFYAGLSNLYKSHRDPQKAIGYFETVLQDVSLYTEQAQWYLTLAYFQAGKDDIAAKKLADIADTKGHYKSAEAAKLLGRIE